MSTFMAKLRRDKLLTLQNLLSMRKIATNICMLAMACMTLMNCQSNTVTDEFEDANDPGVERKLIQNFSITSANNSDENQNISMTYTTDGKLNTITNGGGISIFVYDSTGSLETITGSGDSDGVNLAQDVYQSPYDFADAIVLEYDSSGNPSQILFYNEEWDPSTFTYVTREYTATVTYDSAPNPFFHTLEAGGIIEAMELSQVNFTSGPQAPQLVQTRMLLPLNNPSQMVFRDENDQVAYTINANYTYDADNYPTSATITAVGNSDSNVYSISYTYAD